ncbi:hypothetical protein CBS101457_005184 [Exobasidium rhododendri]|nr:hypothetical protein CBS101457_005184 [Exobasidium rhododendri]
MPKIRTSRTKAPPEGYEEIEGILEDYARAMRDAENENTEGKRAKEALWPIMRIAHTRSRYIYDLYYQREAISKELYDWLLKQGYADANQMEEDWIRKAMLRSMHSEHGHELLR